MRNKSANSSVNNHPGKKKFFLELKTWKRKEKTNVTRAPLFSHMD